MKRNFTVSSAIELEKVTGMIIDDIRRRMDDVAQEIVNQSTTACSRYSRWLAPRRLPSQGAGSYGRRHKTWIQPKPQGIASSYFVGNAYNDHEWAASIEFGQEPRAITAKNPNGMRVNKVLPGYKKGRNINSVPYGTKYQKLKPPLQLYKVNWPGSRAFRIYEESWSRQCGRMIPLMRRVLKEAMK